MADMAEVPDVVAVLCRVDATDAADVADVADVAVVDPAEAGSGAAAWGHAALQASRTGLVDRLDLVDRVALRLGQEPAAHETIDRVPVYTSVPKERLLHVHERTHPRG